MDSNHLITRFVTATRMALDLNPDHIEQEREVSEAQVETAAYDYFVPWAGSQEALIELLTFVSLASFYCWHNEDADAYELIHPIWQTIVEEVPGLNLCWHTYRWVTL